MNAEIKSPAKTAGQNQKGKEVMTREKFSRNKGKSPRFKESYDEDYDWEDKQEDQKRRKKNEQTIKTPNRRQRQMVGHILI